MVPFEPLLRSPHLQTIAGHFWRRPEASGGVSHRTPAVSHRAGRAGVGVLAAAPRRRARRDLHGPRPGGIGRGRLHPEPEYRGPAGGIRGASLSHAHLRRYGTSLPDPLSRRPDQRSAGGVTRIPQGRPRAGISRGFFAGRERGAQTCRRDGRIGAGLSCRASAACRRRSIWQPARAASGSATIACTRRALCAPCGSACAQRAVTRERELRGPAQRVRTGRPLHRALVRLRRCGQLLPHSVRHRLSRRVCACRRCSIQAKDDTFVPFAIYESAAVRSNPWIQLMATEHGGHLGFIGRRPNRLWSDEVDNGVDRRGGC